MALAMVLGGLRAAEVRNLRLADVDMGMRRVRVVGKGNGANRPGRRCVLHRAGQLPAHRTATGVRHTGVFRGAARTDTRLGDDRGGDAPHLRTHRARSGSTRVRPHRLRHTYGTELATAGIDLLVLRELMGHASPETTAAYVHLSSETLAAEFAKARAATR